MTKRILRLLIVIAALLLTSGFQQTAKRTTARPWIEFSPRDGGFSILMPRQPTRETEQVETHRGMMETVLFSVKTNTANYWLVYYELPLLLSGEDDINLGLDSARNKALENGELISETRITLDGYLGREIKARKPDCFYIIRMYLVNQRLYMASVVTIKGIVPADTIRFLDSFKLARIKSPAELAGWGEFSSAEGGFTVWMPGKPVESPIPEAARQAFQNAGASMRLFMHATPKRVVYMASYSDIELDYSDPKAKEDFFEGIRNGQMMASKGGELPSEKVIWLDGHPGREFVIKTPTAIAKIRVYLVGNRFYVIYFITPLNIQDRTNDCQMFFDSFKLVNRQKG